MSTTTESESSPTSRLPPIAKIATVTTSQFQEALEYLHALYRPRVRGSRRRRGPDDDDDDRYDAFERAYAVRWLTALIAQLETRTPADDTDSIIQHAASLLAICAGVAAAGKVQRRFTFESTHVRKIDIDLTDIPLDNHDYRSVGAQTWGGACVLAEMIAEHPGRFGLGRRRPLRILELGAGTGLVGLTVAKLLYPSSATIVLTDFYPAVLDNLQANIDANFPTILDDTDRAVLVYSHHLDWSSFSMTDTVPDVLSTPFDVVFGTDIVYEAQHAIWIRNCLESLLSHPDGSNDDPVFHLVIPLRSTHTFESSTVEEVFGSNRRILESRRELTILSKESIVCEAHGDDKNRTDEDVDYAYYRIGWNH